MTDPARTESEQATRWASCAFNCLFQNSICKTTMLKYYFIKRQKKKHELDSLLRIHAYTLQTKPV